MTITELRVALLAERDTDKACKLLLAEYKQQQHPQARVLMRWWLESLASRGFNSALIVCRYRKRFAA